MFNFLCQLSCCRQTYAVSPSVSEQGDNILDFAPDLSTHKKTIAAGEQISSMRSSSTAKDELELSSLSLNNRVVSMTIEDKNECPAEVQVHIQRGIPKKVVYKAGSLSEEVHEGTFKDYLLEGEGTISWPNFHDRTRNPDGKCQTYQGFFRRGKIIEGMTYMVDGTTTIGKYDEDEVLTGEGILSFPHGGGIYGHFQDGLLTKGKKVLGFDQGYEEGFFDLVGELAEGKKVFGSDEWYEKGRFNRLGELIEGVRVAKDGTVTTVFKAESAT